MSNEKTSHIGEILVGDSVEVVTPRGQKDYEIIKVRFK